MKSAREIADSAAHNYQILKCHITVNEDRENDCVPVLELYRDGESTPRLSVLTDRALLGEAILMLSQDEGEPIEACVLNIEVYTSYVPGKEKREDQTLYLQDPEIQEGLLTVAVTRGGDSHVKLFHYEYLDDGGLFFEQAPITPEVLGELIIEIKGLWKQPAINQNGRKG